VTTPARGTGRPLVGVSVLVPRSSGQAEALSSRLRALGAEAVEAPTISIQPPADPRPLADAVARAGRGDYTWVAFTSPNAVEATLGVVGATGLGGARIAAVGAGTRRALAGRGVEPDLMPQRSTARGLASALAGRSPSSESPSGRAGRVLLPRADIASAGLPRALEDAGWLVDEVEAYRTVPVRELPGGVAERLRAGGIDVVAFSSGSTARNLLALLDGPPADAVRIVSIGPSTTEVCRGLGLSVNVEADPHDLDGLVAAVVAAAS
jgi:uroporphyrinogen III methyltransferase / synthase